MARRLRKKRIAVILLTFTAIIVWTTHSCVSRCTSSGEKEKAEDTLPKAHINDSISNALSEGKEYQELDSVIERYLKRWEINGAQLVITRNDSLLYAPETSTGQRLGYFAGDVLSLLQSLLWKLEWLPTLTVVAALLYVSDRWAEEGRTILLGYGEEGEL